MLDSPHSGRELPADFGTVLGEFDLRNAEDCYVDRLYLPATERGIPLLAARVSRLYLDVNRNADDIDPELLDVAPAERRAGQRQGSAGQGAGVAHARRRPADLRTPAVGSTRSRCASRAATRPTTRR